MNARETILITGASSGIGLSIAKRLLPKHKVIGIARDFTKTDLGLSENFSSCEIDLQKIPELAPRLKSIV
jgi:short-subunit dehydrogenase